MGDRKKLLATVLQWGKIILPTKYLKFFPPLFLLRNPVIQSVQKVRKNGNNVALVVIRLKDMKQLRIELGPQNFERLLKTYKKIIKKVVERHIPTNDLIILHDYYYDGFSLFLKVKNEAYSFNSLESLVELLIQNIKEEIAQIKGIPFCQLDVGYMFLEKNGQTTIEEIQSTYQEALATAEKKVTSAYNEMVYQVSQIIEKGNIRLLAQPIIDIETKEIRAWELLTRGPKNSPYENPLHLFSIARQTGFLYPLELLVLAKAFEKIEETNCQQDIFVNITPLSLAHPSFIHDVMGILKRYPSLSPKQMIFEITERDAIEPLDLLLENIQLLRQSGFRIAVDDTGSGYASFNTIAAILPDVIKIDRSVTKDIDKNSLKESMLKGLMLIAKETGSLVVAEGIERDNELEVIAKNQVDFAQGYFFARPGELQKMA